MGFLPQQLLLDFLLVSEVGDRSAALNIILCYCNSHKLRKVADELSSYFNFVCLFDDF